MLRKNRKYIGFGDVRRWRAFLAPDGSPITMMLLARADVRTLRGLDLDHRSAGDVGGSAKPPSPNARRAGPRRCAKLVDEFLILFANILFAVSLFAVWGVFTLIGVVVDQGKDADFYWQNYTPVLARIVLRLHLDNIYHSPAYIAIIGLILISMTVATFRRVIPARLAAAARR